MDDTLESSAVERILAEKIATFRAEYSGVYDRRELDGIIAEKIETWRFYARREAQHDQPSAAGPVAEVRNTRKPKVVSDKDRKVDDLMRRIDALQRDLELFRKFHGPERELDAQIIEWLKAISTDA